MKKIISFIFVLFLFLTVIAPPALAVCSNINICAKCGTGYTCKGQATDHCYCESTSGNGGGTQDAIFGEIDNPLPKLKGLEEGGLVTLLNNILRLIFVVAGIYAFIQLVLSGVGFIGASGDPKKIEKSWNTIWQSILGLIIIIGSIALAALIGQILFGDASAILNPKIYGPG